MEGKGGAYGFRIDGWTVSAIGMECDEKTMQENPLNYSIDLISGVITFGRQKVSRCYLSGQDYSHFIIYPVISSRPIFDPGEIVGSAHFKVAINPQID